MIEMAVAHDHVPDPLLLFEREPVGETTSIERDAIVEKKAGQETPADAPPGTTQDSQFHDSWIDGRRPLLELGKRRSGVGIGRSRFVFTFRSNLRLEYIG